MKVSIHQPHYFPWMGYFDKMAKVDKFIIMDDVQLVDCSPMVRNKFLDNQGKELLLNLSVEKKGYLEKVTKDIKLSKWNIIRKKQEKSLYFNYKKCEFFDEIWVEIKEVFEKDYAYLIDLQMDIINIIRDILNIKTEIIYQSDLEYDKNLKNSDLVLELCLAIGANTYLSGNGGKKYMNLNDYEARNIKVVFQTFDYPIYPQLNSKEFISKLSILDLLFNCGIEKSREIFWNNVRKTKEI